jgi:tryptophanyl-tRNA synthetase
MSKSYDNTIPLFAPREQLKKLISGIVTDSRAPGEAKETAGSALFQIYQAFASVEETEALRRAYAEGIGWGDAKAVLLERIDQELAPMRERYNDLMAHPQRIEEILHAGAAKARATATPFTAKLRHAVGLRNLAAQAGDGRKAKAAKTASAGFKQYREADGRFYFKLVDAQGRLLLQSAGFDSPRDAGQAIAALRQADGGLTTYGALAAGVSETEVLQAIRQLAEAG